VFLVSTSGIACGKCKCRAVKRLLTRAAIYYNVINSGLDAIRNKHDEWNSMAAGALAGGIFKSTGTSPTALLFDVN
jgi:hypothetical protein